MREYSFKWLLEQFQDEFLQILIFQIQKGAFIHAVNIY